MKVAFWAALILALCYGVFLVLTNWYTNVESDVNNRIGSKDAQRYIVADGVLDPGSYHGSNKGSGSSLGRVTPSPTSSGTASPNSFPETRSLVAPTSKPNVVICSHAVDAFDTRHPDKLIGRFQQGTPLRIGSLDPQSGKYLVVYRQPTGTNIVALCRRQDLGR